jgi:SAM-dependent methyltransferase
MAARPADAGVTPRAGDAVVGRPVPHDAQLPGRRGRPTRVTLPRCGGTTTSVRVLGIRAVATRHTATHWSIVGFREQLAIWSRAFGRGVFPHQLTCLLDLPGRGLIMSAQTVANRLPVAPDAQVLEVGPGSGYYSAAVAARIPDGRLTLVDIQPEMLDKSAAKLKAAGLSNFATRVSDGRSLPFDDGQFDAIYLVTVLGEIAEQDAFLAEAYRVLKPGGVLSVTEHHPDPDFEPAQVVVRALKRHGFVPTERFGWRWAYTWNAMTATPR